MILPSSFCMTYNNQVQASSVQEDIRGEKDGEITLPVPANTSEGRS